MKQTFLIPLILIGTGLYFIGVAQGGKQTRMVAKKVVYDVPEYKEKVVAKKVVYDPPVYEEKAQKVVYDPPEYEEAVAYDPPEYEEKAQKVVYDPPEYEEAVAYDPPKYEEAVAYDPPKYEEAVVYDPPVYEEAVVYDPPEYVEAVAYDPPVYEEAVVFDPPEYAEAVAYDPPVYEEAVAYDPPKYEEAVVYDPPVYEEAVVYDPPEYVEAVAYDPPVYEEAVVFDPPVYEEAVVYDPPVYEEAVAYDPPVYEEAVVFDPPEYAEAVAYDPPVYEEAVVYETPEYAEAVAYDPPVYEEAVVYETPEYVEKPQKVVYDPQEYTLEQVEYDIPEYGSTEMRELYHSPEKTGDEAPIAFADIGDIQTTISPAKMTTTQRKNVGDIAYMKQLFSDFIEDADSKIRPVINQSKPIHVHTKFVPLSVVFFDTTIQKFSILAYFRVGWMDEFTNWRPIHYNGLYFMKVPTTDIWTPSLIIKKPFGGDGIIGDEESDITSISWLGNVQWVPDGTYSVVCDVNIQYYPFDEQLCTITYYMADETYNTLELTHEAEVDMSEMTENSAWKVSKLTVNTYLKNDVYYIDVDFHLQRRPNFTTFTLIMPLLMLAFLNVCIFLVPVDSGEKGGFAITIFLAYGIFISILSDTLPNNSIQTSYFVIFITIMLGVSALSVMYVIVQAKITTCMGIKESLVKSFIPDYMKGKEKVEGVQPSMNQYLKASSTMKTSEATHAWKLIFQKIDMVLFFVVLVIVLVSTTSFFCVMLRTVSESELNIGS